MLKEAAGNAGVSDQHCTTPTQKWWGDINTAKTCCNVMQIAARSSGLLSRWRARAGGSRRHGEDAQFKLACNDEEKVAPCCYSRRTTTAGVLVLLHVAAADVTAAAADDAAAAAAVLRQLVGTCNMQLLLLLMYA